MKAIESGITSKANQARLSELENKVEKLSSAIIEEELRNGKSITKEGIKVYIEVLIRALG